SQRGAVAIRNFRLVNDKVHSEGEREGSFTCSDSRLSQLWEASVRTCDCSGPDRQRVGRGADAQRSDSRRMVARERPRVL
ncbi:MAG: hypothetical protein IJG84_15520, partial [Kiritimatiellae bacterium]|nr:hypothetical protein [Kiritimatiellia bacterium]